jgi:mRNA interferase YafQ
MLTLQATTQYRKDYKLAQKRGCDVSLLNNVIETLLEQKPLEQKFRDHALKGNYVGFRECHIQPDWLLIYKANQDALILVLVRTGTHSDLFGS